MKKRLILICSGLLLFLHGVMSQDQYDIKSVLRNEYPSRKLLSYAKGSFTGSVNDEYVAFYGDLTQKDENSRQSDIDQVTVFIIKQGRTIKKYDLSNLDVWSLGYSEKWLRIARNPLLKFGNWNGYSYIADYNDNGFDEILFFQLSGSSFMPMILEFDGKEFQNRIEFDTYSGILAEIRSELREGRKMLRLYGYGNTEEELAKRDWYLYSWEGKTNRYMIVEKGLEQ